MSGGLDFLAEMSYLAIMSISKNIGKLRRATLKEVELGQECPELLAQREELGHDCGGHLRPGGPQSEDQCLCQGLSIVPLKIMVQRVFNG